MAVLTHLATHVPTYLSWSWLSVSVPNLIVIGSMVLLFVLALVLPFPKDRHEDRDGS
ncbi:hypothetical protein [Pengzhenrongella sp.]|jgi:drug/metabolite transporter superfamily protein YnfA|uniref:hypothetical protein n=1 Tax=Pengzhenrongella sp. TaxID=2888820 RepID=UPI002F9447D1